MAMANNFSIKESLQEMVKCPECEAEMKDKDTLKKHMNSKHNTGESYNHTNNRGNERRYEMTEEKLQEDSQNKLIEEHKKVMEELTLLRNERRTNLVNEYKKLCSTKKVKEKDVANFSDDVVKLLIEQIKDITIEEKALKSVIAPTEDYSDLKGVIVERSENVRGTAIWQMPDANKYRELHSRRSYARWQ